MPTSHPEFVEKTEASQVADAYPSSIRDKVVLITGTSPGGVGGATAVALAAYSPQLLVLSGRNSEKVQQSIDEIKSKYPGTPCKLLQLDLASQESCRAAAKEVLNDTKIPQIDLLINNAGIMSLPERNLSPEGIELQFATNHIGHFLFTNLILPKLFLASKIQPKGTVRVVNLSSRGTIYSPIRFSDYNHIISMDQLPESEKPNLEALSRFHSEASHASAYLPMVAYGQSKTANILFSLSLTQHLYQKYGILSVAVHPGFVMTELGRHNAQAVKNGMETAKKIGMLVKNLEQGSSTTLVAALDPKLSEHDGGCLLSDCQIADWTPAWAKGSIEAEKLWSLSEELVGEKFGSDW